MCVTRLLTAIGRYRMTSKHLVDGLVKVTIVPTEELASLRAECQVANEQRDQAQRWYREKCAEVEALKRTVSFMEQSYLEEHGNWGNCQWKIRYEQLKSREITDEQIDPGRVECPECGGSEDDCPRCHGNGWIREERCDE